MFGISSCRVYPRFDRGFRHRIETLLVEPVLMGAYPLVADPEALAGTSGHGGHQPRLDLSRRQTVDPPRVSDEMALNEAIGRLDACDVIVIDTLGYYGRMVSVSRLR